MRIFKNRMPLSTYFNNPGIRKNLNDLSTSRQMSDEKRANEFGNAQYKMVKELSRAIDEIVTSSKKRKFIAEKNNIYKPHNRKTEFNSEFLNAPSRIRLKRKVDALYEKYEIDLDSIDQLKRECSKSLQKLFYSTMIPESKLALPKKKIKKNRDFFPPFYSDSNLQDEYATHFNANIAALPVLYDAYGFSNEQSGHIYLNSTLGITGASDDDYRNSVHRRTFLVKFVPHRNGRLFFNFRHFVHNRSLTTYNYNEPGYSEILSHNKETIPVVGVIGFDDRGNVINRGNRRLEAALHRTDTIPALDSIYHLSESNVRRESDYFLISDRVIRNEILIIEFGLYMYHSVNVNDVSFASFVSEHHEFEKIGLLVDN